MNMELIEEIIQLFDSCVELIRSPKNSICENSMFAVDSFCFLTINRELLFQLLHFLFMLPLALLDAPCLENDNSCE